MQLNVCIFSAGIISKVKMRLSAQNLEQTHYAVFIRKHLTAIFQVMIVPIGDRETFWD